MVIPTFRDQSLIRPMTCLPLNPLKVQTPLMNPMMTLMAPMTTTTWNCQFVSNKDFYNEPSLKKFVNLVKS